MNRAGKAIFHKRITGTERGEVNRAETLPLEGLPSARNHGAKNIKIFLSSSFMKTVKWAWGQIRRKEPQYGSRGQKRSGVKGVTPLSIRQKGGRRGRDPSG